MIEQFKEMFFNREVAFAIRGMILASIPTTVYLRASGEEITALELWGAIWNKVLK